jgi:hypothetical protein
VVFLVIQVSRDGPGIQESVVRRGNPVIVVYLDLVASVGILVGRDIVVSPDTVGNLEQVDIPVIVESLGGVDIQVLQEYLVRVDIRVYPVIVVYRVRPVTRVGPDSVDFLVLVDNPV